MPKIGKKVKLEDIIRQAMTDKVKVGGKKCEITGISLLNVDSVNSKAEVYTMQVMPGSQDASDIAETIEGRAETFASGSEEKKKFELVFFYGNDTPRRHYVFWISSEVALGEHGAEEATAKGLVKNYMSQHNRLMEMTFAQINANMEASVNMVAAMTHHAQVTTEQLRVVREERDAAVDKLAENYYAGKSKEHEYRMEELERQKKNELWHSVLAYLPGIANQIMKKNIFPQAQGDSALLKGLLASLDKMDKKTVLGVLCQLPQEVAGPIMSRGIQLKEEEEKRQRDLARAIAEAAGVVKQPELPAAPDEKEVTP